MPPRGTTKDETLIRFRFKYQSRPRAPLVCKTAILHSAGIQGQNITPPLYLDVASTIKAGYSTALDDFRWLVPQQVYDSLSRSFIDLIEAALNNASFDDQERVDIALSLIPIANECFSFACSYINVLACEQAGREYFYSEGAMFYPGIVAYRSSRSRSVDESLLQMESRPRRRLARDFVRSQRGKTSRFQLGLKSRLRHPGTYRISSNTLGRESETPDEVSLTHLVEPPAKSIENIGRAWGSEYIPAYIADGFASAVSALGFDADELLHEYMRRVSAFHLDAAKIAVQKNYEKYLNTSNSVLVAGTAGGFASRLMSHVFQRNNLPVVRFSHGGERGLMDDVGWHYPELMFTDKYVVHGRTEAKQVQDAVARRTTSLTSANLLVVAAGSKHHRDIRANNTSQTSPTASHNIMVVANSFKGERRPVFATTGEEVTYFEWHLRLLKALHGTKYRVISKRHPKGNLTRTRLFSGFAEKEITELPFTSQLMHADAFIFDFAASAFMEALSTNKPVVLIEFPHRMLSAASREEVARICTVVSAEYDENNRIVADMDAIVDGIEKPVDPDLRQTFVENYLMCPSNNLAEMTDLLGVGHQ